MNVSKVLVMVPVEDMDRAVAFYRSVFGLAVRFASPDWSELTWRDATIALHGGMKGGAKTGLGFEVDDLAAACESVKAHGGKVVRPPKDRPGENIRLADVTDCEGNAVTLSEPIR